jgi:hypothetical protein
MSGPTYHGAFWDATDSDGAVWGKCTAARLGIVHPAEQEVDAEHWRADLSGRGCESTNVDGGVGGSVRAVHVQNVQ